MKLFKIFAIATAALSFAACSDDEPTFNTEEGVVVEMGQAQLNTKEGRDVVTIPVNITGERNGNIAITFAIDSDYENPATDEQNIFFTTRTIVVFPEDNTYDLELGIVDDDDMNEPRWCDVKIASVEGGSIGEKNFTTVQIRDNDTEPYDRAAGKWKLITGSYNDAGNFVEGSPVFITLVNYDEESPAYKKYYQVKGLVSNDLRFRAYYYYDEDTKQGYIEFQNGQSGGTMYLNESLGDQVIYLMQLFEEEDGLSLTDQGVTDFHFSAVEKKITTMSVTNSFLEPEEYPYWGFLFNSGGWAIRDAFYVAGMTR